MQGRLSPLSKRGFQSFPLETWEKEFDFAKIFGIQYLEWLVDLPTLKVNPLWRDVPKIKDLIYQTGIEVQSLCFDATMHVNFKTILKWFEGDILQTLLCRCTSIGIKVVCIPMMGINKFDSSNQFTKYYKILKKSAYLFENFGIKLALETDLTTEMLGELIQKIDSSYVGITLDVGNLYSQKQNAFIQFNQLSNFIKLIHLKDRSENQLPIRIGEGKSQVVEFWKMLKTSNYSGLITLELFRGKDFERDVAIQLQQLL